MSNKMRVILQVFVEGKDLDPVARAIAQIPSVTDVYEITGEADIFVIVETEDVITFRNILKDILTVEGIRSTVSSVVTYVHKHEGQTIG